MRPPDEQPAPHPFDRRQALPALTAFAAFIAGLAIARHVFAIPSTAWFGLTCAALAAAALTRGRACIAAMAIAMLTFGAAWHTLRLHEAPTSHPAPLLSAEARHNPDPLIQVRAVVLATPQPTPSPRGALAPYAHTAPAETFPVRLISIRIGHEWQPVSGRMRVRVNATEPLRLHAGDRVTLAGRFQRPLIPLSPGEPDWRLVTAQRGDVGTLNIPNPALIRSAPIPPGLAGTLAGLESSWLTARAALRDRAHAVLGGSGPDRTHGEGLALVRALILGERGPEFGDLQPSFARLGLAHLMAISGFHLGVMAAATLFAVRCMGERGWQEPAIVAALLLLYLLIVPARPPIVRAGCMVLALLAARAIGRRHDPLAVLAWVALALLIWRPADLWALGYQLSFGLTAALIWLAKPTEESLATPRLRGVSAPSDNAPWRPAWHTLRSLLIACLVCWLIAIPTIAHHTGIVSPLAIPATVLVLPLILFLLWGGYAILLLGMVFHNQLAEQATLWLAALGSFTASFVDAIDRLPGSSFQLPAVSVWWAAFATLPAVLLLLPRRRRLGVGLMLVAIVWLGAETLTSGHTRRDVAVRIDMLAVGDGACLLIRSEDQAILWDAGSSWPAVGERRIPDALRQLGVTRVDRIFISHPGFAHYSALPDLIEPLGVEHVVLTRGFLRHAVNHPFSASERLLRILDATDIRLTWTGEGDEHRVGRATLRTLAPPSNTSDPVSMVVELTAPTDHGPAHALLTGGARDRQIESLLQTHPDLRADILELPRRGQPQPEARALIEATRPAVVLQSSGRTRTNDQFWSSLRADRTWWTTAHHGAAWVEVTRDGRIRTGAFHPDRQTPPITPD